MMIPCQRCGSLLPENSVFCPTCGLPRAQALPGTPIGPQNIVPGGPAVSAGPQGGLQGGSQGVPAAQPGIQTPTGMGTPAHAPGMPGAPGGGISAHAPGTPGAPAPVHAPGVGASGVPTHAPGMAPGSGWQGPVGPQQPGVGPMGNLSAPQHLGLGQAPSAGAPMQAGMQQMAPGAAQGAQHMGQGAGQAMAHGMAASHAGHMATGAAQHGAPALAQGGATLARKAGGFGLRRLGGLLKRSLAAKIVAAAMVTTVVAGAGAGYLVYRANEPSSFVIATDRGNSEIARIDIATRDRTVLIKNTALNDSPDSIVFISNTQVLIDFVSGGNLGIGDIQNGTYTQVAQNQGTLRDMAVRPDGSSVLIAAQDSGKLLEFNIANHTLRTFVQSQNLSGVAGLAFDPNGNLYAAVGSNIIQLDATSGKQIKTFQLPGGTDGMAYDQHLKTLDIASGNQILTLDPTTGKIKTLIDGIVGTDGVAIDRHGNLFIASEIGVLELTTDNQLLIVGTDSNGVTWDDVAPLSGTGAASY